jgi:hypothetical protein
MAEGEWRTAKKDGRGSVRRGTVFRLSPSAFILPNSSFCLFIYVIAFTCREMTCVEVDRFGMT